MWWDLFQQAQIHRASMDATDARMAANSAKGATNELGSQVRRLQQQVEQLQLALMAVTEILHQRRVIADDLIQAKIAEIDLRDGRLDGKITAASAPKTCAQCAHANNAQRTACLYCGAPLN